MLFEEANELVARNTAILAAGDAISLQTAGIKPFGHRARGDLTDFGHLAGGEHFLHGGLSSFTPRIAPSLRRGGRQQGREAGVASRGNLPPNPWRSQEGATTLASVPRGRCRRVR